MRKGVVALNPGPQNFFQKARHCIQGQRALDSFESQSPATAFLCAPVQQISSLRKDKLCKSSLSAPLL